MACLEGPHGKVKSEYRQRVQDLGHMILLGSHDGVLCVSQDCVRLIDLNQKNRVLVSLIKVLSKRHTREGAGSQRITCAVEELLSGTYICL